MKYLAILLYLCMCISISAQDIINDSLTKKKERKKLGSLGLITTRPLPKWSIKKEVNTIEKSLNKYDPLIESLEKANHDLKADLSAYLKNPGDQVLAARITAKMSSYAKLIVHDVDKIIGDQDVLLTVFNELNQKLNKFSGYLDYKVGELNERVKKYEVNGKTLKKQLKVLAREYKREDDPRKKEKLKQEFRRIFNKYNLNTRYEQGMNRNKRDYETLSKNLKALVKMFSILNQAFSGLIENLSAEKKYLLDNIRLQADAIRVQKLVHEGISDGSRAVVKITKKLALLYAKVEGFAKVHEKINRDMAKFADSTKILGSLVKQVEKAPFQSAPTIDKAIEYFADAPE